MAGDVAILCEGLTKDYGRKRALDGLDLEVRRGEIFGYLGSNGAGKTTTIRCLLDLIRPTAGRATILGHDAHRDSAEVHRRVGYLPGDLRLYPRLTANMLLQYLGALRRGAYIARIEQLAERFDCPLDQPCGSMSHGQRQKVGLIQALMHDPALLILDEPTATLDPLMQHRVHDVLTERRNAGTTVFLSSHDLTEISTVCDRAGILQQGRLVAVENVSQLAQEGRRVVSIEFLDDVDPAAFSSLHGVHSVEADDHTLRISVTGDLDAVIKTAARYRVRDMHSEQLDLDVAFRHYYESRPRDAR